MSTGQHAFSGRTTGLIFDAILNREPVPPRKLKSVIPTELEQIITKALEKDRDVRYQHAADIRADLKRLKRDTESGNLRALRGARRARPWTGLAWVLTGAVIIVLVAVASWLWKRDFTKPSVPQIRSLAVLPLENLSHDPEQEYFADGMTEELITDLSQINALKVISRKSVMHYKNADKPISQIAQELGVDTIVEGSVRRSGNRVRISAQLIYAPTETPLWAQSYDRELKDALAVQSALAGDIADQIRVNIKSQHAQLRSTRAVNPKALDSYLKGVYYLKKWQPQNAEKAVESFRESIVEDPNFAMAYVQLANAYGSAQTNAKTAPLQREAIGKALSLDPSLADVHLALANFQVNVDYDWNGAEREYRRALELNHNSPAGHGCFASYLNQTGRFDEALKEAQAAQELDDSAHASMADYLYFTRQYDRGIELEKRMIEIHPDDAAAEWWQLFHMYLGKGMESETLNAWRQTALAMGYTQAPDIRTAYAKSGFQGALRQSVKWMEDETAAGNFDFPEPIAEIYVLLGDKDKAFYWLEKAHEERDGFLMGLVVSPIFDPVRPDARYKALVKKIGFPQITNN
jgi:TolB-like protein/Tfp pilus assembly protein PilF